MALEGSEIHPDDWRRAFRSPLICFEGKVTAVPTTGANTAYIMHRDNRAGKGQLIAVFPSGAVQVIATKDERLAAVTTQVQP